MNDTKTIRNQIFEDRSIYADNYYETLERSASTNSFNLEYGAASTAVRCATTLLIKAGYILIQTACIPTWNVYSLIYFNLVDFVSATFGFLCIGFFLSFGKKKTIFAKEPDYDEAVLGWCVAVFSSTIVTVLLAGRLTKTAFFIVTTVLNWLIAPLFFYFIYSEQGVMYKQTLMDVTVSVKDYGGCLLIHVIGSLIGLIGILFLGRRVMRLKEIYECSMGPDAPGLAVAGYFFIMIGMTFLNVPSRSYEQTHLPQDYTGLILVNNLFAAVGSMTIVIIFGLYYQTYISYWFLLRIIQAGLAGMVMISAGQDVFTPLSTLGTSVLAGITFYWGAQFAYFSAFEDYCNIVAIHLIPGFIGMILPGLYASTDNMGFGTVEAVVAIAHLLWQIICLIIALVIVISAYSAIFFILRYCSCLRNSMEEIQYNRALRIQKHTSRRKFYQRIFPPKPTSIALLPGYDSKQIFKNQRLENPHEMNDRLMPNNVSMFAKSMTKNPFQNEFEEPHKKKFVNFFENPDVIEKSIEPEFLSLRTRFTTAKSSSEPLLDIQPLPTIIRRRCSTTGILDKSLLKQRKFIQRPWNIHQKVRLYDLKKTEKRCNIALGNIEKCHTMEPITNDDHYSVEVINLNDETVKIIKSPINIDDYYDSISESEI